MKPNTVGRAGGLSPHPHPISDPAINAGFISGTVLLTRDGEMPVEFLSPGDHIITRDAGMVPLIDVHHSTVMAPAISFAAGSLGHTRPDQDLILPAAQMILIRDWRASALFCTKYAMVRADTLVDGEFVCDLGAQKMILHQLRFKTAHVVYAGGLELSCMTGSVASLRSAA
jgi:hypothetical protein